MFKAKNFQAAIQFYTVAIQENPSDHTIYGNRSAAYHNTKNFVDALKDGDKCIELKSDWAKGYQRKAMALHGMRKYDEATQAYSDGLKLDPANAQLKSGLESCQKDS
jgi:stress-induced-phosphoprotein 1